MIRWKTALSGPLRALNQVITVTGLSCRRFQATSPDLVAGSSSSGSLLQHIQSLIRANGPMSLPVYMKLCLQHPQLGYYTRKRDLVDSRILGKTGDFITSPEISQIFGELIAIWLVSQWQAQGCHPRIRIVELGPGPGTLMEDILRTLARLKQLPTVETVDLVETSTHMRRLASERLEGLALPVKPPVRWYDSIEQVDARDDYRPPKFDTGRDSPEVFTMLIAHEFFDALPVQLFERRHEGWREVCVDAATSGTGPPFRFVVSPNPSLFSTLLEKGSPRYQELKGIGARAEVCGEAVPIAHHAARLLSATAGGAGLIIDYGDDKIFGNSLRAFRDHQLVDPLANPGETDLTTNVDFGWLKEALDPAAQTTPLLTQRDFLLAMGLSIRIERMLKFSASERHEKIKAACDRLIDPTSMGMQYRFMGITPKGVDRPFPFSELKTA